MKNFFKPLAEAEDSSKGEDVPEKASENGAQGIEVENSPKNAIPVMQARTTRLSSIKSRRSSRRRVLGIWVYGYWVYGYLGIGYLGTWVMGTWVMGIGYLGTWVMGIWVLGTWVLGYLGIGYLGTWVLGTWVLGTWVLGIV